MHATSRSFLPLALVVAVVAGGQGHAVTIDWVTVGDPGNANDPATGNQRGAVNAEYRIMKFEWTNTQYAAFLNAIDPDGTNPNSVYNSSMASDDKGGITNTGSTNGSRYATKANMGDKPVNFVNWWDAARVANWLQNGAQTYGSTDATAGGPQNTGAYTTGTATNGSVAPLNAGALYRVPSEDEWYKAAFFNPTLNSGAGGYTIYGNGFSAAPTPVAATLTGSGSAGSVGNFANYLSGAVWNGQTGNVTTVGTNGAASYYGVHDMSGNLWEWNDLDGTGGSTVGVFGGDFGTTLANVSSSGGSSAAPPAFEGASNGFRLASAVPVPEPSTCAMVLAGLACGGVSMWRRRERASNLVSFVDKNSEYRPMRSSQARSFVIACGVMIFSILATRPGTTASAAPVVWGAAQNISSDSDVNTSGSLVYAYQFGASLTGTTTVNDVPFQPFNVPNGATTVTAGSITLTSTSAGPSYGVMYPFDGITSASAPFANLSIGYQGLLSSAIISNQFDINPGAPLLIELGGLTAGTSYLVQWWSCATNLLYPYQTVAPGSPNVTLDSNTTDTAGGLGQYATGTFTASGSSMTIDLQGLTMNSPPYDSPTINALQVRAVPEPSTYALALASLACGGCATWRRRKRA